MSLNVADFELSPSQEIALLALVSGCGVKDAASRANVDERTLFRWLKEPSFKSKLRESIDFTYRQGLTRLTNAMVIAVDTLVGIMTDPDASDAARVRAALGVIDGGSKWATLDLSDRLNEVEKELGINQ